MLGGGLPALEPNEQGLCHGDPRPSGQASAPTRLGMTDVL